MARQSVSEYQEQIVLLLRSVFVPDEVQPEWASIQSIEGIYSPRLDLAVGPFSLVRGSTMTAEHDRYLVKYEKSVKSLLQYHHEFFRSHQTGDRQVLEAYEFPTMESLRNHNRNARCFLAVEIENKVTRKHLLGGALNASALGRIGIIIPWAPKMATAMVRLLQYWSFLRSVDKNAFDAKNLLIVTADQFRDAFKTS